jgi:serine/threonine-protein kinase RsbW
MSHMADELRWLIKCSREELARLVDEASAFAEARSLSPKVIYKVSLTLEEVLTNIVKYAFSERGTHTIEVTLEFTDGAARIQIVDQGREFDPCSFPPPQLGQSILQSKEGGLGIHLVRQAAESMDYRREDDKNVLIITIR